MAVAFNCLVTLRVTCGNKETISLGTEKAGQDCIT